MSMGIRIQPRDRFLLRLLAEDFLLLTREQIQELIPRTKRRTNQRLALLVAHKVIARKEPKDAWDPRIVFYYLGEKAAQALERDAGEIAERRTRARNFKPAFLRHLYFITMVHSRFLVAIRDTPDYILDCWVPSEEGIWKQSRLGLRPDGFALFMCHGKPYCYFIEVDRGTEHGKYLREKIDAYASYERFDYFLSEFQEGFFRVLFITQMQARSKQLLKLFPSDLFLTATLDTFRSRPLFDPYWSSVSFNEVSLDFETDEDRQKRKKAWERSLPKPPEPPKPEPVPEAKAQERAHTEEKNEPKASSQRKDDEEHEERRHVGIEILIGVAFSVIIVCVWWILRASGDQGMSLPLLTVPFFALSRPSVFAPHEAEEHLTSYLTVVLRIWRRLDTSASFPHQSLTESVTLSTIRGERSTHIENHNLNGL